MARKSSATKSTATKTGSGARRAERPAPALPPPAPTPKRDKSYMQRWRENEARGYDAEKWARLELELGRFGLGAAIASGFILVFTAYLATILGPNLSIVSAFRRPEMVLWFLPLSTSLLVSGATVAKKLGPYRRGYASAHFVSSVVALVLASLFFALAFLDHLSILDLGFLLPILWPASPLGMALALVSLALTWEGVGLRRVASMAAALVVPVSLGFAPLLVTPTDFSRLTLVYALDSMFFVFSGSTLLLIASGAEASQREILRASDTRYSQIKEEMAGKLQALAYKEKAYVERESHLDAKEKDLLEIETELDARTKELNTVQTKLDAQGRTLTDLEARLAKMRAEVEAKVEEIGLKDKDLKAARGELEGNRQSLSDREAGLAQREKDLKRVQIEVTSKARATEAKGSELSDLEARLKKEDTSVETRRNEIIRKEKDLQLKESEVKLKIEQLEAQQATGVKEKMTQLRDWESKILAKEREIGIREAGLQSLAEELKERQANGDAYAAALQQERDRLAAREEDLNAQEKALSDRGSGVEEKVAEIERRWREAMEAQKRMQGKEAEYNALFKDAKLREADFSATKEEVSRRMAALDAREGQITKWKAGLEAETKKLQAKVREMMAREKAVQSKESDVSLKELEVTKREQEAAERPPVPSGPGPVELGKDGVYDLREKAIREREDEFKRRMYQREKELEARETALREQLKAAAAAGATGGEALEPTPEAGQARGDRLRTGTPRLDDLLYGGLPMNANILFVGPAYVGKEVAILNFLAEGLKASIPAVIVTTSKPPVEIAKEMAPVLPTFMEYEQLGLVRWIDASGTTPTQKMTRDGHTFRVPNAVDFEGILRAVDEADDDFRKKGSAYFRFAFLSLSSALTQTDDKSAIAFVQRFVNRLRQTKCVAAFAIERGMHTDQQVESLQQLMDGALMFRQDKSKTLISVVGVGEVQTRDWVPYKFTNKALMVGSFQLERIR